ncbi:benzoate/H(+) symporter BenE family transporter [Desulfitibacter alkalitolerans]|uniref:benzoate/H(+) symporter BenE family transporter n=1 Tax=Desulfitibacter alkalitolerans TaxID=264641 RepID=UPI00047FB90A|nr:benzoate/H(+) symporter BenE family transporter [Desulfitibacter alkalitolerans]
MGTLKDLNYKNSFAGIISGLLAITGPPALILQAASNGGFTNTQTIMWVFSVYTFGGIFSILAPLYYRMPIVGAHSITGVAFLATVTAQFTYQGLIGAYILAGVLMLIVGSLGIFSKLMSFVPKQIIASMLAGMIVSYMINYVTAITRLPLIGGLSLLVYFVFSRWDKRIPPVIAGILTAIVLFIATETLSVGGFAAPLVFPSVQVPEFGFLAFFSVSIPLALVVLSNDAAVGLGALEQNDYHPPINRLITLSGIFTIIAGFFGGQSTNVAGMMSAICSNQDAGPKEKRYWAAIVSGIILVIFGVFSWKLVPFIQGLPQTFTSILLGFALLGVFGNSLNVSFSKTKMKISTTFAFVIAASNITFLNISSPIWSLLIGTLIARGIEKS